MGDVSSKPYFIRAIYEWCSDCGYTPYLSVKVDDQAVSFTPDELGRPLLALSPDFQRIEASWSVPAAPPEDTDAETEAPLPT